MENSIGRLKFLVRKGGESSIRQLAGELKESVRETRILMASLKESGDVVAVRKNMGAGVRVYYRRAPVAGAHRVGESGAVRGVPRLHPAAS